MNVYDKAHELSTAIKESNEFKEYEELKKKIDNNENLKKMMDDFREKQVQLQVKQYSGESLGPEDISKLQELEQILVQDPTAAQYLQAEMRFSLMINDVFKILGDYLGFGIAEDLGKGASNSNGKES